MPTASSPSEPRRAAVVVAAVVLGLLGAVGAASPAAGAPGDVPVQGHGWGHGRGMGQYGALGYANAGWGAADILGHFYSNTQPGTVGNPLITVRLIAQDGQDLVVTSSDPYYVGDFFVDATRAVRLRPNPDGTFQASVAFGCGQQAVYTWTVPANDGAAVRVAPFTWVPGNDLGRMLTICGGPTYRGAFRYMVGDGAARTVNLVPLEDYLLGVVPRESPSSWPAAALQAQAVAARSYAMAEGGENGQRYAYAKTCDTTACQVYGGAGLNGVRREADTTNAAIAATAGLVRRFANGQLARTEFSASTGGWTAGGVFPAVPDAGDSTPANPYHNWTHSLSPQQLASRYGLGTFQTIRVTQRNGLGDLGGRALAVEVTGTAGRVVRTGNEFRADWQLRSDWFEFRSPFYTWLLRDSVSPGPPTTSVVYGVPPWTPLLCDWDGNGTETLGLYDSGHWYLRNDNQGGPATTILHYGTSAYVPVCGDWDGDGDETIGVYDRGWWYLRNDNSNGPPQVIVHYGAAGYTPVVGDWDDGAGQDGIGVYANGHWLLRNTATPGAPEYAFAYGAAGYIPVVGDWDGVTADGIGVYVNGQWLLRQGASPGIPEVAVAYGAARWIPVPGDTDGNGTATLGVVVPPA